MANPDLLSFYEIVRQALLLNESVFSAIQGSTTGLWLALLIVSLAGISEAVGQSIVLFINRVKPWRFGLALFTSSFSHIFGYLFWTASIWLIDTYGFDGDQSFFSVAAFVGLAYSPRLFSFFILTPFLGNMFSYLLSIWSLLVTIVAIAAGLDLSLGQAVVTGGLGWAIIQIWYKTLGRPLYAIGKWVERRAAGVPMQLTLKDIAGMRRPVPEVWEEWKTLLETRGVQLPDQSLLHDNTLRGGSVPPVINGSGKGR
ncbi:MAG: hypothetical protein AAF702_07520 [Chloroflexota bacterium]